MSKEIKIVQENDISEESLLTEGTAAEEGQEEEQKKDCKKEKRDGASDGNTTVIKLRNGGGLFKGLILGLIAGLVIGAFGVVKIFDVDIPAVLKPEAPTHTESETAEIIEEHFTGYTALDFGDQVVGEAKEKQELIVMEEDVQLTTELTQSGLGNLDIFKKTKRITYYGTGLYTVDLSEITTDSIEVDNDKKTVKLIVPHAELKTANPDYDKTEFEDTELGMFAIFDMKLTAEQQQDIEKQVKEGMTYILNEDQYLKQADEFAKMKTWETFQPLISSVAPDYKLEVEFDSTPSQQ